MRIHRQLTLGLRILAIGVVEHVAVPVGRSRQFAEEWEW